MLQSIPRLIVALALLTMLGSGFTTGQAPSRATVRGMVKDAEGAPVPGALLKINTDTIPIDGSGRFSFVASPSRPFQYVIAEHPGFEIAILILEAKSNEVIERDIVLKPNPDCPDAAGANPPASPLVSTDFVEVEFPSQLVAGYRVRIRADGEVTFRGAFAGGFVVFEDRASVATQDARALLERFRSAGFWRLCGSYRPVGGLRVSDGPLTFTTIQLGNQIRRVVDDFQAAPAFLRDLQRDFYLLANTDRWWRPSAQSPTRTFVPVPGLTSDMVRRQLAGNDINALDARGWTPLMYATQHVGSAESIKAILDAGANVRARSRSGDTVLMIAATAQRPSSEWISALIAAGADVNAQDRDGRTALALAVLRFGLPEGGAGTEIISILRKAGARVDIRDSLGMTPLDYFEQDAMRAEKFRQKTYDEMRAVLRAP